MTLQPILKDSDFDRFKKLEGLGVFMRGSKDNEEYERLKVKLAARAEP